MQSFVVAGLFNTFSVDVSHQEASVELLECEDKDVDHV